MRSSRHLDATGTPVRNSGVADKRYVDFGTRGNYRGKFGN